MSITCHWIDTNNQKTEFTVTLLKPLKECIITDFNNNAFAASYDQINNVAYVGSTPQRATENSKDTVWFNTSNRIDFSTLHFSSKSDTTLYRRTLVLAVPQYTEISSFTIDTLPDNVYLVSDIQAVRKTVLINSVQYRNDFLRTQLNFSTPLKHCLYGTVFDYKDAAELITDGTNYYKLIPVFLYVQNDQIFITRQEPYNTPVVNIMDNICGFADGIACFNNPEVKLCLGVNPNDRQSEVSLTIGYYNNIIDSVYGDMFNIYDYPSTINADIKLSIYSEQDNLHLLYLQRGILLNEDCYAACASQYGFIFINALTDEIYEPAMRDGIVEGYKELVYKPVKFRLLSNKNSDNQLRTVPPVADVQISNEQEYYTVGVSVIGRWQVRKYSINDLEHPELVEDFGARTEILDAYLEADGDFDYFAGDEHVSLVTSGTPWLVVIRASDKHMYVKKVGADVSTAVLLDTDVEQASVCRGWKSDKFNVDAGLIVAYRKATGVFMRVRHEVAGEIIWDTVQQILDTSVEHVEVKRLNDFRIGIYTTNPNKVMLSDRYYIGGTSKTEYLQPKIHEPEFRVWSVTALDGQHDDLQITNVVLINNGREFEVTANYPFYSRDNTWNDISVIHAATGYDLESYRIDNGKLILRMNQAYTSPYVHAEFRIRLFNRIKFYRTPQSIPICPEITIVYLVEATGYNTEHYKIEINTGTCNFRVKERKTYTGYHIETFRPAITATASLRVAEVTRYNGYNTEHFIPQITISTCTFKVEQSGVTPV